MFSLKVNRIWCGWMGRTTIPLNSRAMKALRRLKAQRIAGCPIVFATQTGKHLSYRNLPATMEKACETAGVKRAACTRAPAFLRQ